MRLLKKKQARNYRMSIRGIDVIMPMRYRQHYSVNLIVVTVVFICLMLVNLVPASTEKYYRKHTNVTLGLACLLVRRRLTLTSVGERINKLESVPCPPFEFSTQPRTVHLGLPCT
jgi:hypothetical protein